MQNCFAALMSDPQAALGAVVHDRVAGGGIHAGYLDYLRAGHRASGKPAFLVANRQGTGVGPADRRGDARGLPRARRARVLPARRAPPARPSRFRGAQPHRTCTAIPEAALARMRARLADRRRFDENDALTLLGDAGLPANAGRIVEGEAAALAARAKHRTTRSC